MISQRTSTWKNSKKQDASNTGNVRIIDSVKTVEMLSKNHLPSVNQTMAQIKITEKWKAAKTINKNGRITRSRTNGILQYDGFSTLSQSIFIEDLKRFH